MLRLVALVLAATLAVACGDSDPTCEQVADHVVALVKAGGAGVEVAPRDALVRNCKAEASTNAAFRRCAIKATDLAAAKACELQAALRR